MENNDQNLKKMQIINIAPNNIYSKVVLIDIIEINEIILIVTWLIKRLHRKVCYRHLIAKEGTIIEIS